MVTDCDQNSVNRSQNVTFGKDALSQYSGLARYLSASKEEKMLFKVNEFYTFEIYCGFSPLRM